MQSLNRNRKLAVLASLLIITALSLEAFSFVKTKKDKKDEQKKEQKKGTPVLWRDTGSMRNKDLYYGPGSKALAPVGPFKFVKEIKDGKSPKFDVVDARGLKWRVKLGPEAQAETVSSRLVWAAGYNAEESTLTPRR